MNKIFTLTVEAVDAILPQTQCGDCDYAGCKPYAEAIVNDNEAIDKCPPGGVKGLEKLAALTDQTLNDNMILTMSEKQKPRQVAVINEDLCIGCTKCLPACPVDAIVGAHKLMHTVLQAECNGCGLCLPPCPMDCIEIVTVGEGEITPEESEKYRKRYAAHTKRLEQHQRKKREKHLSAKKKSPLDYLNAAKSK
ncbi:MAG: 4Fe-4S ferredoxin [Gammaproteobacteria bacterium CG11_big_fil_rev_8_21_14_0_20_46_22]|nr:MAG: 4Fe-4S ferredoxin [Gammaproteobacteria bacterium CG12_big_fil_rev_8_21_14_0_65_46_12]PIR11520.1 MAG: 4Fe-4S ferredoxin [Gammaproteobacteria bacterium CG11_big_fil_rev_8_21_14_0_20_46_22]